jgi:aryl-alcohol dehydrogenase-like predicted oxidoreductase
MIERVTITDEYSVSRIIKGGWQLSGGHGFVDTQQAIEDMLAFYDVGITTFDCADIYTGVEELIGQFLRELKRKGESQLIQVHTKYVPDLNTLSGLTEQDIRQTIKRSIQRLGVQSLDLVQFHWWDFAVLGYIEAAKALQKLQAEGLIQNIGVTNFDTEHLGELLDAGVKVVSNQVQYSVLDNRPKKSLTTFCEANGISLLCYGSVAGGLLSEKFLNVPEPGKKELSHNRSLIKYRLIVDDIGGWDYFQSILACLQNIGEKHEATISEIAMKYILDRPQVAAIIVGATGASHLASLDKIQRISLTDEDAGTLQKVIAQALPLGEVYGLERHDEKHKNIMKYNLNKNS